MPEQSAAPEDKRFSLTEALELMQRAQAFHPHRPLRLVVKTCNPGGLSGHQTTEVKTVYAGIDWEAGQVIVEPAEPLTRLSPEDVKAIVASVRAGSSWHAYQRDKVLRERINALEAEVKRLSAGS